MRGEYSSWAVPSTSRPPGPSPRCSGRGGMRTARPVAQGVSTPSSGAASRTGAVQRDQSRDTENIKRDWSGKEIIKRIQKRKSKKII